MCSKMIKKCCNGMWSESNWQPNRRLESMTSFMTNLRMLTRLLRSMRQGFFSEKEVDVQVLHIKVTRQGSSMIHSDIPTVSTVAKWDWWTDGMCEYKYLYWPYCGSAEWIKNNIYSTVELMVWIVRTFTTSFNVQSWKIIYLFFPMDNLDIELFVRVRE